MTHVLIAEPDYSIRELLKQVIGLLGWTCDAVASGPEAWKILESKKTDLLITEVVLRKMSGMELVWCMRFHPSLYKVPVVFLGTPCNWGDAHHSSYDIFVAKPFHIDKLMQQLSSLVSAQSSDEPPPQSVSFEGGYPLSHWGP
jgi:DNA-binding response OmpR family regulator